MLALILRSLKDRKYQPIIFTIAAVGFLEMYIALFPALQKQAQQMSALLDTYPESFWKAFNIDKSTLVFDKIGPFLGMEHFNFIWPILVIILVAGYAGYALANEVEKGTVEVVLSQPLSRTKIFISRYLAGLASLIFFTLVSILAIIPLTAMHGISIEAEGVFALAFISLLFGWSLYAIAFLASAIFSEKSKVSLVIGGLLILMYVAKIVSGLKESLTNLQYISFVYYYDAIKAIEKTSYVDWAIPVFVGTIIICSLAAWIWFDRRDVAV